MVLTSKQKNELHGAIADYLSAAGFEDTLAEFVKEAGVAAPNGTSASNLLEKKWTSVVRLQKKINDLEAKLAQADEDLAQRGGKKGSKNTENLPKPVSRLQLAGCREQLTMVKFHPVLSSVVACSEDATVKMWDYESGDFERSLRGHTSAVNCIAFDPLGNILASCSADLSVKLWDMQNYTCTKTLQGHEHNVSGVVFIPPGDYLASCSRDNSVKIWETATGYCVKTLSGHDDWVRCISASADGKYLATGSNDQSVRVWEVATGSCVAELRDHTHVVETVMFAPDVAAAEIVVSLGSVGQLGTGGGEPPAEGETPPTYLVSGSRDKTIKLWALATQQCVHTFVRSKQILLHSLLTTVCWPGRARQLGSRRCFPQLGQASDYYFRR